MSTKIKSVSAITARIVLGLIYFVFGLNFFFHFIPMPPSAGSASDAFMGGLFQSGYFFPMLKGIEVISGALLLIGIFVPLDPRAVDSLGIILPNSLQRAAPVALEVCFSAQSGFGEIFREFAI